MLKSNDDTHLANPRNSPIANVQPTNTRVILYPTRDNVLTTYTNPKIICKSKNKIEISKIACPGTSSERTSPGLDIYHIEGAQPIGAEIRLFLHALVTSTSSLFHCVGIRPEIVS
jgi:hypothetical protein